MALFPFFFESMGCGSVSANCNMLEPEDNMDSVGTGTQFDSLETQAMVMVPMSVVAQPSLETQEQGKTEGTKKVVIDVDEKETEKTQRKELAPRSKMWQHFIKIKDDKGLLKAGRCKYCHHDIKADTRGHGTSALKKHFGTCKCNPHVFNKDPKQGTLQSCWGEAPTTWRFDQEALREAFAEMFKEIAKEEKVDNKAFLKLDVPTRWNYTYLMLKATIVYEKVFLKLVEDDTNYVIDLSEARDGFGHPDEDDWDNAKKMAQFLHHFHDLTVRISSSLQVTRNTFFHEIGEVYLLIQEWLNSEDNLQVSMGMRIKDNDRQQQEQDRDKGRSKGRGKEKEKDKENINLFIFVAAFLDPRYKLSLYTKISVEEIFGEERCQLIWAAINTCVRELFEEYRSMYAPSEETTQVIDADQSKRGA
ncbi:unnamed protein product [Miscanthus lutarioriparius]|uniref:BED-type domain-containing protein n=1 Tax=Miscanthus lutarioriparius TaxID=422564 RepID=A0A811Q437_9POAL|nr:unnamed protein product [Miscanthus lutarioriparius]